MTWPAEGFIEAGPFSRKWACAACGSTGFPGGAWMDTHRRGHLPCPHCGRPSPVKLDGTARVHTRCPKQPESVVQHVYAPTTEDAKQSVPDHHQEEHVTTTYNDLLRQWEQDTREHADTLGKATTAALRTTTQTTPGVAEYIALRGVSMEGGKGVLVSKDRIEHGPWVRVYDAAANNGDGAYVWARGRRIVPDHAIEEIKYANQGDWDAIDRLAGGWPSQPCSESLVRYPSGDADEAIDDEEMHEANFCPSCEREAPIVRDPAGGWLRTPHRRNGDVIELDVDAEVALFVRRPEADR